MNDHRDTRAGLDLARADLRPDGATGVAILRSMIRVRRAEEAIGERYKEQEMRCPTHLCIGHEAIAAAVSAQLRKDDEVYSGHRSHGHYLAKGGDLNAMVAELYGRATGCARGKGGSQHLVDLACGFMGAAPILASTISVGVGAAWAAKLDGVDRVTVVYFGDGATEEGTFHEAVNFASVRKLPVLFVCENNLYSVHSTFEIRQPEGRPIADLGRAHRVPSVTCDGNDPDVLYAYAATAVARARRGDGPSLIEGMTYRWREHCGPGDDWNLGYRDRAEFPDWQARDPVATYAARLQQRGELTAEVLARIERETADEVAAAFAFAKASPFPGPQELLEHLYPEPA
jgi:TPP-dependent pyruvate/acetoin dehydrogenase alpha subunit